VYTSLAANEFFVTVATKDHFVPGAYSNTTTISSTFDFREASINDTTGQEYQHSDDFRLFKTILEGHNTSTPRYEDLTPSECIKLYNKDFVSDRRNLFLITNHNSNTTHNDTLLETTLVTDAPPTTRGNWMCNFNLNGHPWVFRSRSSECTPGKLAQYVKRGYPWPLKLREAGEVEISGCKSEITDERCKVQFSLGIMIAVICCNLVKACCMVMTVVRSREPTLVTLGDAVDSFLRTQDPTTMGICFADRRFIKRGWRHGRSAGPRQWKQKGAQRWWTSVSRTRWITCNLLCLITIIVAGVLLRLGLVQDGSVWGTDLKSM